MNADAGLNGLAQYTCDQATEITCDTTTRKTCDAANSELRGRTLRPKNEKLAESLEVLANLQEDRRRVFVSSELSRTHRDRLKGAGFVTPLIKGWWMATDPAARPGDTTAWHASFWKFCSRY